jgi:hypothetical protein
MLIEAAQHPHTDTSIEKIYFVLFDTKTRDPFQSTWATLQRNTKNAPSKS